MWSSTANRRGCSTWPRLRARSSSVDLPGPTRSPSPRRSPRTRCCWAAAATTRSPAGRGAARRAGGAGHDREMGGLGNDTYRFADNWGNDKITEVATAGVDRFDFSAVTGDVTFTAGSALTAKSGKNLVSGASIENLSAGSGNDTLV